MIVYGQPECGLCKVLKTKLLAKNIQFQIEEDIDILIKKGIRGVPVLELDDGTLLNQYDSIAWVNSL